MLQCVFYFAKIRKLSEIQQKNWNKHIQSNNQIFFQKNHQIQNLLKEKRPKNRFDNYDISWKLCHIKIYQTKNFKIVQNSFQTKTVDQ